MRDFILKYLDRHYTIDECSIINNWNEAIVPYVLKKEIIDVFGDEDIESHLNEWLLDKLPLKSYEGFWDNPFEKVIDPFGYRMSVDPYTDDWEVEFNDPILSSDTMVMDAYLYLIRAIENIEVDITIQPTGVTFTGDTFIDLSSVP